MKAPFRSKPPVPHNDFQCNEDPKRLDRAYIKTLGDGGDKRLTEDVKWLAVTHKSFDHGRRGFNDRLAYLGKKIVDLQLSLAMLQNPRSREDLSRPDEFGRQPPDHPDLDGVENLSEGMRSQYLSSHRLGALAARYGVTDVMRWKPRMASDLRASGIELIGAHTLYAIIGALALQKGGEVATKMARERILAPLKVKGVFK